MKQLSAFLFSTTFLFLSFYSPAQAPVMTSWVSDAANDTQIQLRMHDRTINQGYSLVEVSFDMSAARCALSDEVRIYIYQNDGVGTYGTQRYSVSFDPGPGTIPISTSEMTRILVVSVESTEPIYARAVISGVLPADDFVLTTPDCLTTMVTSDAYDPNEHWTSASSISGGTTHEGLVVNNDADYYEITLSSAYNLLDISMSYLNDYRTSESNLDLDLFLVGSTGSTITSSTSSATSTSSPITETIQAELEAGTYYITVRPKSTDPNRNFYTLFWDSSPISTYTISGHIEDDEGTALQNVTLGGLPGDPLTDLNGDYSVQVPQGWSGTVTPSLTGNTFTPGFRTYTNVISDQLNQDYTGEPITFTISGNIRIVDGMGLPREGIELQGFPEPVFTDAAGNYSATVEYGWSGLVFPIRTGMTFDPNTTNYSNITSDQVDQDYDATIIMVTIYGEVRFPAGTPGLPLVYFSGITPAAYSNSLGDFSFEIPYGSDFEAIPTLTGYSFDPGTIAATNVVTNLYYIINASLNTYEISGTITISGGAALSGVTLSGLPGDPVTDINGDYSALVDHGWSGTVTPTLSGYTFDPVSSSYTSVAAAQVQDYTATPDTHVIDGYVRTGVGTGIAGVLLSGLPGDPLTDATGYYSGSVLYGSSYTVTPTLAGWSFTPVSSSYSPVTGDVSTDYTGVEDLYLTVNQHIIMLGAEDGANDLVTVTANVDWTVVCPASWITCTPESGSNDGSFTVSTNEANPGTASRETTVTVSGGGITHDISVSQAGSDPYLEVSSTTASLGAAAASTETVDISSNVAWTVSETADWLSAAPASGSGDATLTLTADLANASVDPRSATVTVTDGVITRNIEVTQAGAGTVLEVSATTASLGAAAASTETVDISSNIAWTVSETADWLSAAPASGSGDATLTLTADLANATVDPRSTTVIVSGGGITRNIEVTQAGAAAVLEVSTTSLSLGAAAASSQTVDITSNLDWTASESVDWLSLAPESGSGDGSLTITTFLSNESIDDRSTTVVVSGGGITRNINVTQAGADPSLGVSAPSENLAAAAGSSLTLNIYANIDWTASLDEDWLSVSPSSGTGDWIITITADSANPDALERFATLNVEGEGMIRNITITQDGSDNTGIEDLTDLAQLELYPNPARNRVFIKSDRAIQDEVHITVLSMAGNVMQEIQLPHLSPAVPVEIDLTGYPVGQYLIQLDNSYIQRVFRVIKNE